MGLSVKCRDSVFFEDYITVKTASIYSGYSDQYIRRLLRNGFLKTKRIGQIWLIERSDFQKYLQDAMQSPDKRFGPHL